MPSDPKALTHQQMRQVIERGGSVSHKGQIITRIEELPSEGTLADDPNELQRLIDESEQEALKLRQRQEALRNKQEELRSGKVQQPAEPASFHKLEGAAELDEFQRAAAENDAKAKREAEEAEAKTKAESEAKAKAEADKHKPSGKK